MLNEQIEKRQGTGCDTIPCPFKHAVSIEFHPLVRVAGGVHETDEILRADGKGSAVIIRMEGKFLHGTEVLVEEDMDVVVRVVHQPEGADRTGAQPEVTLHALRRGKTELALAEALLQVADGKGAGAVEDDQVVPVALVVAEEKVFAVGAVEVLAILHRQLDGGGFRVLEIFEADAQPL